MKKIIIVLAILILVLIGVFFWWNNGLQSVNKGNKSPVIFVVNRGEGVRSIANRLKSEGLIRDPIVFFLLTKRLGIDNNIEAGDFRLNPSMSAEETAKELTHGTLDIWITIPEGKRADEIADILKVKIPNYNESFRKLLDENEGYLFPDTYLISKDATATQIVALMKNNFKKKYKDIQSSQTKLSQNEIVILASLIEREARNDKDRPLVASVILNRLDIGMALQIDSTVQYALGFQESSNSWWKKSLTQQDIKTNSPFNTYLNPGLPPGPICNPGILSLQAAANPASTDYLYYLSDKNGQNHYAKTLQEHNANIRKYSL